MTTQQLQSGITEADATEFVAKLDRWVRELTPRERVCLAALVVTPPDEADATGFLLVDDGSAGTPQPLPTDPFRDLVTRVMQSAFRLF